MDSVLSNVTFNRSTSVQYISVLEGETHDKHARQDKFHIHPFNLANKMVALTNRDIEETVDKFNRKCGMLLGPAGLRVELNRVMQLKSNLNEADDSGLGLWGSLWYSPKDMSVFVRSECNGSKVDVALCTQDVTHRSNFQLEDIAALHSHVVAANDTRVGSAADIARVDFSSLSPVIRNSCFGQRNVHRIYRPEGSDIITVELARRHVSQREVTDVEVNLDNEFGSTTLERKKLSPQIEAAWLICMTMMIDGTTDFQLEHLRTFILDCHACLTRGCMNVNVNYESMFRARSSFYQDGRVTWPVVLGLCMADNLTDDFSPIVAEDISLKRILGTYKGSYGWRNWIGAILLLVLGAAMTAVMLIWKDNAGVLAAAPLLFTFLVPCVNYCTVRDATPWSILSPYERQLAEDCPVVRAVEVLLSESSRTMYNGEGLCFTGDEYIGPNRFPFKFEYTHLCKIGFLKKCDSSGREYLTVPTKVPLRSVRLESSTNGKDHFKLTVDCETNRRLYDKLWESHGCPGGECQKGLSCNEVEERDAAQLDNSR